MFMQGPNAFLMVGEEGMKDALKACTTTQKAMKKSAKPIDVRQRHHRDMRCTQQELISVSRIPLLMFA